LDWLYWDWIRWALGADPRSRDAADWHDRWLPGVLARIRPQLAAREQRGRHISPASQRRVPADLNVAGHAPEAVFIEQMALAGQRGSARCRQAELTASRPDSSPVGRVSTDREGAASAGWIVRRRSLASPSG
jgi:hypothetical protein